MIIEDLSFWETALLFKRNDSIKNWFKSSGDYRG